MSVLVSQFVSSSPSPTVCTSLFSMSEPLFLPANRLISTIFLGCTHSVNIAQREAVVLPGLLSPHLGLPCPGASSLR